MHVAYDDRVSRATYLDMMDAWARAVSRALAARGSIFLNMGSKPSDPSGPFEVLRRMQSHFTLQNTFHWIKSMTIDRWRRLVSPPPHPR